MVRKPTSSNARKNPGVIPKTVDKPKSRMTKAHVAKTNEEKFVGKGDRFNNDFCGNDVKGNSNFI